MDIKKEYELYIGELTPIERCIFDHIDELLGMKVNEHIAISPPKDLGSDAKEAGSPLQVCNRVFVAGKLPLLAGSIDSLSQVKIIRTDGFDELNYASDAALLAGIRNSNYEEPSERRRKRISGYITHLKEKGEWKYSND